MTARRRPEAARAAGERAGEGQGAGIRVRPFEAPDLPALYRICLLTADAGGDASALYRDPDLPGHLYLGPYATLEPRHALVAEDEPGRPGGYCVGAFDSRAFAEAVRASWLPPLCRRYPDPPGSASGWSPDERLMHALHHPDDVFPRALPAPLAGYPSHLHIDLLPRLQGRGAGRALIDRLLDLLREAGSTGVHLGVDARNERALGFYRHLGFLPLCESDGGSVRWLGKRLTGDGGPPRAVGRRAPPSGRPGGAAA